MLRREPPCLPVLLVWKPLCREPPCLPVLLVLSRLRIEPPSLPVLLMSERHAPGPMARSLLLSRFTVGRHFCIRPLSTLMSERWTPIGPGPPLRSFPFHCWSVFHTSRIINIQHFYAGHGPYTGTHRHASHHPFHCWLSRMCTTVTHFLSRNVRITETLKRH